MQLFTDKNIHSFFIKLSSCYAIVWAVLSLFWSILLILALGVLELNIETLIFEIVLYKTMQFNNYLSKNAILNFFCSLFKSILFKILNRRRKLNVNFRYLRRFFLKFCICVYNLLMKIFLVSNEKNLHYTFLSKAPFLKWSGRQKILL